MKYILFATWSVTAALLLGSCQTRQPAVPHDAFIPYPAQVANGVGTFTISGNTLVHTDPGFKNATEQLQRVFTNALGQPLPTTGDAATANILLQQDSSIQYTEGYRLSITAHKIILAASTPMGMFHATETLRQLFPPQTEQASYTVETLVLPVMEITDAPQFAWRGVHLDVARHFFSIAYLEKLIDRMALYKFNKLHLHLTDDQGWRIEIKQYPLLTTQGGWRSFNKHDTICMERAKEDPYFAIDPRYIKEHDGQTVYGGFYTQEEMKALVAYAAARYIDIVPELDMPGHMGAANKAYPSLTCVDESAPGGPFSVPMCPCKDGSITFAKNVYTEIMDIFPSEFIHLGADEVRRASWENNDCKALMQREGLETTAEIQSYFVKQMEQFFQAQGRKLIGWDEILEGGLSKTAYMMYWRSWKKEAPLQAVRQGNPVIMCPVGNGFYFDFKPTDALDKMYDYALIPEGLTESEAALIMGAQANLWSERVASENRADYAYFPRLLAVAERVWSPDAVLNYDSFQTRLPAHYQRLGAMGVHYRLPDLKGFYEHNAFVTETALQVTHPVPGLTVHYTTDGTLPSETSPVLPPVIPITASTEIKMVAFRGMGRSDYYTLTYEKEPYQPAATVAAPAAGLWCAYYAQDFEDLAQVQQATAQSQFETAQITVPDSLQAPFTLQYGGYIDVPETGVYRFFLQTNDEALLTIGDKDLIQHDGTGWKTPRSAEVALEKGLHPLALNLRQGKNKIVLQLQYSTGGGEAQDIPVAWFKHP